MNDAILVTGATGTVGSEVVKQLAAQGVKVRAAVHTLGKADKLKGHGVEIVELDYDKPQTYNTVLKGAEKVFFVGFAGPTFAAVSKNFAEAARKAGVRHFVKLSAYGADFAPEFIIAKSHRDSEKAIEATGIAYAHLRPNVFMQNFINYTGHMIKSEGKLYLSHGDSTVSFIDVRDVARVAVEVLTHSDHEGKAYTLTGAETLSYYEAAEILSRAVGKTITYVDIPRDVALNQMKAMGQPDSWVEIGLNMADFSKSGGFSKITSEYEKLTGEKPITLKQFAQDYAEALK